MTATTGQPALDTRRPFSRQSALAAEISLRELRSSAYQRIFNGVYADAGLVVTPAVRAEAALVPFGPRAFASHASAARLLGVPIPVVPDEHVSVFDKRERRTRPGIMCHVVKKAWVRTVDGVRASSPEQTFIELATLLSLIGLVVVGDHLVRLRMLIVLAGLPEPVVNMPVEDGAGERRYDLCWPDGRLIVEYDGRQHAESTDQWTSDLDRREAIDDTGWRILVVTAKGIYNTPERTVENIARVLRERGQRGVPSRLSDAWRPHFPSRGSGDEHDAELPLAVAGDLHRHVLTAAEGE